MANNVAGVCAVCGRAGKVFSCQLCGAFVCDLHYDPEGDICMECKRGRKACRR